MTGAAPRSKGARGTRRDGSDLRLEHYATAILEKLVHAGRTRLPARTHAAAIEVMTLTIEEFDPSAFPRWDGKTGGRARYGDEWHAWSQRTSHVPSLPGQRWSVTSSSIQVIPTPRGSG